MSNVSSPTAGNVNTAELFTGGGVSVQLLFAQLQLTPCQANKDKAMEKMETIKESQALAKETANMIAKARDLQQAAKNSNTGTTMPADMKAFYTAHGLTWDTANNDDVHTKDQWEYNIKSLTNYQEQLGTDTQQLMVFIQDFMGQYNSYLQGANSAIQQSNQTLQTLARGQ